MGINPENPRSVLILRSPSGGRHYYVFLDAPYCLDQIHGLLQCAGLRHVKGRSNSFHPRRMVFVCPSATFLVSPTTHRLDSVHQRLQQRPDHPSFPGKSLREPG